MIKIAIDAGAGGAVAFQIEDKIYSEYCPATIKDTVDLIKEITINKDLYKALAVLEKVHAMPGNGVTSTWKFAENYSMWKTALITLDIPLVLVPPQKWMKTVGNMPKDKKERKNYIKSYAQQLYPEIKVTLKNADALAMLSVFDKII